MTRTLAPLATLAALLAVLAGCDQAACGDVGRAIADKTLQCEGSESLGVGRARALEFTHTCPDGWWADFTISGACVRAIEDLDCADARANGEDLEAWLASSPACDDLAPKAPTVPPGSTLLPPVSTGYTPFELPCSVDGGAATALRVTNATASAFDLYWVDVGCLPIAYGTVPAGGGFDVSTFVGHAWAVLPAGRTLFSDAVVLSQAPAEEWVVGP